VANILAFDFFFVPPQFSFDVEDTQYIFTMGVMLIVALVIANLVVNIRRHRDLADMRERRTSVLYAMSRELAVARDMETMAAAAVRHVCAVFHSTALVLIADERGLLSPVLPPSMAPASTVASAATSTPAGEPTNQASAPPPHSYDPDLDYDPDLAQEVVARGERLIGDAVYLPLQGSRRVKGVLVVRPQSPVQALPPDQLQLLDAFAVQLAHSLRRARLAEAAEAARIAAERASLRNTLLASISHDLRTPLSAIAGAGSLIAQPEYSLNSDRRTTLGSLIERKARDMSQLLSNILELMQIESSNGAPRADWHAIEDLVAHSLRANEARLAQRRIVLDVPADLPLVLVEATLIVQILSNLLENAAKYTPPGTTITISAAVREDHVLLAVADDGPGLPPGDPQRLFDKFQRGRAESTIVGVGLGLAICRAAAHLHGGDIMAMNPPEGGARFEITLPVETQFDASPPAEPESLRN
jgi:two-component system sensor histidine kinase KdpD